LDPPTRYGYQLPAYRTPELGVSCKCGHNSSKALQADCMRAGEEFGAVLSAIEHTQAGSTGQEGLIEVLVVDGDRLHQGAAQVHDGVLVLNPG